MTRESVEDKGRRYLVEGRLLVEHVDRDHIVAAVRGAGEVHQVTWARGGFACTCEARGRCAHLVALQLVTAPVRPAAARP